MPHAIVLLLATLSLAVPRAALGQEASGAAEPASSGAALTLGVVSPRGLVPRGLHGGVAVRRPLGGPVALRLEGLVADGAVRGGAVLASVELDLGSRWRARAGSGVHPDDGLHPVWALGVQTRLPWPGVHLDIQYLTLDGGGLCWGVSRAFPWP